MAFRLASSVLKTNVWRDVSASLQSLDMSHTISMTLIESIAITHNPTCTLTGFPEIERI